MLARCSSPSCPWCSRCGGLKSHSRYSPSLSIWKQQLYALELDCVAALGAGPLSVTSDHVLVTDPVQETKVLCPLLTMCTTSPTRVLLTLVSPRSMWACVQTLPLPLCWPRPPRLEARAGSKARGGGPQRTPRCWQLPCWRRSRYPYQSRCLNDQVIFRLRHSHYIEHHSSALSAEK